jgi:hypothetical protein
VPDPTHGGGWIEPEGGRVVPVYALTGGRTRAVEGPDMPVEALVTVTQAGVYATDLQLEYRLTVELAATPISIVEISASLGIPVGVARVLVSDLVNAKYLVVHLPPEPTTTDGGPAPEILERLLDGLRAR